MTEKEREPRDDRPADERPEEETPASPQPEETDTGASPAGGPGLEEIALLRTDEVREALEKAKERDEYLGRLQRVQAEYENYRKRVAREREGYRREALRALLLDVLEVVDNFERALGSDPGESGHADFVRGIELVEKQLAGVLTSVGVRPIEARGEVFDPALHEAIAMVESEEAEPGTVTEVLLVGYTMDEQVLRPSRVCVAQQPAPQEPSGGVSRDEAETEETPEES
jgi:molecular chaperone GrpE